MADYRHKTGRSQAKQGKTERSDTANRAIARKQEDWQVTRILLWLAVFGLFSAALYIYLAYVVADDDDELTDDVNFAAG